MKDLHLLVMFLVFVFQPVARISSVRKTAEERKRNPEQKLFSKQSVSPLLFSSKKKSLLWGQYQEEEPLRRTAGGGSGPLPGRGRRTEERTVVFTIHIFNKNKKLHQHHLVVNKEQFLLSGSSHVVHPLEYISLSAGHQVFICPTQLLSDALKGIRSFPFIRFRPNLDSRMN